MSAKAAAAEATQRAGLWRTSCAPWDVRSPVAGRRRDRRGAGAVRAAA
ncbi:hypothetical protein NKH77_22605 [Streptomyces sp. M19]